MGWGTFGQSSSPGLTRITPVEDRLRRRPDGPQRIDRYHLTTKMFNLRCSDGSDAPEPVRLTTNGKNGDAPHPLPGRDRVWSNPVLVTAAAITTVAAVTSSPGSAALRSLTCRNARAVGSGR